MSMTFPPASFIPPTWRVYMVAEVREVAGVSVRVIKSLDQLAVQVTSGPVTSPACNAAYIGISGDIA
jgi:hypothetical protein